MAACARVFAFLAVLCLVRVACGNTLTAVLTIDSSQSPVTLDAVVGGLIPVAEQTPGSLTSQFRGMLTVDLELSGNVPTSVSIRSTSAVGVVEHPGDFLPDGGPADFAGIYDLSILFPGVIGTSTLHESVVDLSGGPQAIDGSGTFDVAGLFMRYTATMFWNLPGLSSGSYNGYLDDYITNPSGGHVNIAGDLLTLSLPYSIDLPDAPEALGGVVINYHLSGVIVATALVPEPRGFALMAISTIGLCLVALRQCQADR
jgi:hypothetical protein